MTKIKILITSVGSLVGKNLLDVLDYETFNRRHLIYLIGVNSLNASANNFRCDKFYEVPNTSSEAFETKMIDIIKKEEPDLILSGRDIDTKIVSEIVGNNPNLKCVIPYGNLRSLSFGLDKWKTWEFSEKHNLPFASTFVMHKSGGVKELEAFVEEHGFPLIAKPIEGFASQGVFFLRNLEQVLDVANYDDYMIQEYLGDPNAMDDYFKQMDGPTPLFAHAPDVYHHTCHTLIEPDGRINEIFITKNNHQNGATVSIQRVKNLELEKIGLKFAKAYIREGGCGPFGVQFRQDKNGAYKAQEINLRMNGNTFPRLQMGQDDLGIIIKSFLPDKDFPIYETHDSSEEIQISKSLECRIIYTADINTIDETGFWNKEIN